MPLPICNFLIYNKFEILNQKKKKMSRLKILNSNIAKSEDVMSQALGKYLVGLRIQVCSILFYFADLS